MIVFFILCPMVLWMCIVKLMMQGHQFDAGAFAVLTVMTIISWSAATFVYYATK